MMLDELPGRVRTQLVHVRCVAMRNGCAAAIRLIDELTTSLANGGSVVSQVLVAILKGEILHLDGDDAGALAVFEKDISHSLAELDSEYEIIVRHNYNDVQSSLWDPSAASDFYNLVDQRRMARFDLLDSSAILSAKNAAAHGKHYEALPDLWNELRRTYRQACWRAHRWAAKDFAEECMHLGWHDEACIHAILALDSASAKQAGQHLVAARQKSGIVKALDWMLMNSRLQRHFTMACAAIGAMADAVPNATVPDIYKWASERAAAIPSTTVEDGCVQSAWQVIVAIAHRLNESQAIEAVDLAILHPWWHQVHVDRKTLRSVVGHCTNSLSPERLRSLAYDLIGHIVDRHEEHDYVEAINLICHIADVGGESLRNDIGEQIYQKGAKLTPALVQVAGRFNKESGLAQKLDAWAQRVAESLLCQVQRLKPGAQPQPCNESYFFLTITLPDGGQMVVHCVGSLAIHSVLVHRHSLSPAALDALIDSVLRMLEDKDNVLANKTSLLQVISRCGDIIAERYAGRVFEIVAPFARGQVSEPEHVMSAADAANPLNPFKMGTGKPSEVQAVALYALAKVECAKPGVYGESVESLLEDAINHVDAVVRQAAYSAWREMPRLPASVQTSIILGTRDPDERVAIAAYDAIAASSAFQPSIDELKVLCQSLANSLRANAPDMRRFAAKTCRRLSRTVSMDSLKTKLAMLLEQYRDDVCYSVRTAASEVDEKR